MSRLTPLPGGLPRHNHTVNEIQPEGECPVCDFYHNRNSKDVVAEGSEEDSE